MNYPQSARTQVWKGQSGLVSYALGIADAIRFRRPFDALQLARDCGIVKAEGPRLIVSRSKNLGQRGRKMATSGKAKANSKAKAKKSGKPANNGKSLTDVVRVILGRAKEPMRGREVAEAARPVWERMGNKPPKHFDGMVWHACQAVGTLVSRGFYELAKEGKAEGILNPVGQRRANSGKPAKGKKGAKAAKAKATKPKAKPKARKVKAPEPEPEPEPEDEDEDADEDEDTDDEDAEEK